MIGKLFNVLRLIRYIRNWPLFLYDFWKDGRPCDKLFLYRMRNGMRMFVRAYSDDKWVIPEVVLGNGYWHPSFALPDASIIIDAGANIGAFTLSAKRRYPEATIIAIEPTDATEVLTKNVEVNGLKNVTIIRKALAGHVGMVDFHIDSAHSVFSSHIVTTGNKEGCVSRVPTTTLEEIMASHQLSSIDLLKCDIEGGEYDALLSAPQSTLMRIRNITMEYHLFEKGRTAKSLVDFFTKNGFTLLEQGSVNPEIGLLKFHRTMQGV